MASSRIFVRGLPPSLSEDDFRKHFSHQYGITDAKFFPQRRIGYVGYKSPEDAAKAVKYFNKTFIRMSRIAVELARPVRYLSQPLVAETAYQHPRHGQQTEQKANGRSKMEAAVSKESSNPLKRKRSEPESERKAKSDPKDEKLAEYLKVMTSGGDSRPWDDIDSADVPANGDHTEETTHQPVQAPEGESDDEYQAIAQPAKRKQQETKHVVEADNTDTDEKGEDGSGGEDVDMQPEETAADKEMPNAGEDDEPPTAVSDADWLRSRTSRLLGLVEDDEEKSHENAISEDENEGKGSQKLATSAHHTQNEPTAAGEEEEKETLNADETAIRQSNRLFVRNLPYSITEDDLRKHFTPYGELEEVHIPMDTMKGVPKGFAYIQFATGDDAVQAYRNCDGTIFQGRLLHVLPAAAKRETKLDDYAISQLPQKKQKQIRQKAEAAKSTFSWNSLYMNADAVMSSVSDRLGVDKAVLLDPTSSDAAVKQALAETHVIQDTKTYFAQNGVDLDAFKRHSRGDTAILVKNFPYGTKPDELRKMFEEHGKVIRFLMPPSGTIAIVEFGVAPEARAAFASLAYRKIKDSVLFLEKAPRDLFFKSAATPADSKKQAEAPVSAADLIQSRGDAELIDTTTLFVRNLNFSTTSERLAEIFKPLEGFMSARVKTKTNPKKPEETLSMGFGFLEFRSKANAQAALAAMDGHNLDGHQLVIKASQKSLDAAEERRRTDRAKKLAAQKSKIIIKNLPFEASKKDVRELLRQYGQLRSVRVPKKFDNSARGYAFAEFVSPSEAANAMAALGSTHLLGRKLVMEFAAEEAKDAEEEIERMAQKVGEQTDKVALQKLVGKGRRKFNVGDEAGGGDADA
ncbi:multiple RNA-binding domain-containing protein 1 [Rhizodiscina lignyota]|uniref:Multiple RNA-binding domain-containing protein 1 n=1 Tax=Rhizodiscina lignyota TaxID=1504668 RepID=A0A9P4I442_9PEZI|nr:multiple RNA-binding domain-containing protein 1 [Rhizodiscina lignyota]